MREGGWGRWQARPVVVVDVELGARSSSLEVKLVSWHVLRCNDNAG